MHIEFMRSPLRKMPAVRDAENVTSLTIWHCKFDTLDCLTAFRSLKALKIAGYPDTSLAPISQLKQLEWLSILHLPKVSDLEPLTELSNLVSLELATLPSWDASGKRQMIRSLDPLAHLPRLAHLALHGVVPDNKSLSSITTCSSLRTARLSGYPAAEVKRFYATSSAQNSHVPEYPEI